MNPPPEFEMTQTPSASDNADTARAAARVYVGLVIAAVALFALFGYLAANPTV